MNNICSRNLAAAALAAALVGCGTLPDGRPFAEASSALSASVKTSGQAVSASIRDTAGVLPAAESKQYGAWADSLDSVWAERVKATEGAVAYSEAIAGLIAAGQAGTETAKQVGDDLGALATAAGIPIAAPVAGVAGDIARFLIERIAIVRASDKLEDALEKAQPAVNRIAEHLADEAANRLRPILIAAYKNSVSGIKQSYDADSSFVQELDQRRDRMREAAMADSKKVPELLEFDRLKESASARLKERDQKLERVSAAYGARLQLINALASSASAWATAHRDLAAAIRERRKVTVTELRESVNELRDLIKKVRDL
jgi:hypothetical protein